MNEINFSNMALYLCYNELYVFPIKTEVNKTEEIKLAETDFPNIEIDVEVAEEKDVIAETDLEPPYKVLIHNDNITTFEFVIRILQQIFGRNIMQAEQIAMNTHVKGIGYVGSYGKSDAEKRIGKAKFAASLEGFPLQFTMEAE